MGWGGCNVPVYKRRRRPRGHELPPDSPLLKLPLCDEFVWNVGAAVTKTACFAGFVLAEWPRRFIALSTARPFPPPLFTCEAAGGYRMCACGQHFYEHGELITGPRAPSLPPEVDAKMKKEAARRVRRRRRFWLF